MHVVFFCLYESGFLARERAQAHHRVDRSFKQCFFVKTIDFRSHIKLLACSLFCFAVCAFSKLLWGDACVCVCVVVHVLLILGPGNFCLVFLHHLLYIWIHMNIYIYFWTVRVVRLPFIFILHHFSLVSCLSLSFLFGENRVFILLKICFSLSFRCCHVDLCFYAICCSLLLFFFLSLSLPLYRSISFSIHTLSSATFCSSNFNQIKNRRKKRKKNKQITHIHIT